MSELRSKPITSEPGWFHRPEFRYSLFLFLSALLLVTVMLVRADDGPPGHGYGVAAFFLLYGLFTINTGYQHPRIGYVSFDRVSQIASILVLGPLDAAWINGLASLIFPWKRTRDKPLQTVLTASLNNAGLMTLMILACGSLYAELGGEIPLTRLTWSNGALLLLLILTMQALNEIGLGIHIRLRDGKAPAHISPFVFSMESASGLAAILVAIVFNRMELPVFVLLLAVLTTGMLALRQFASMRIRLENMVDERTRVLRDKTLELERLATHDQLTGLFNRRFADTYLDRRIDEYNRYGRDFSIALIDLDHFKRINDQRSHEVGDAVLKQVARILAHRCRETDMVARYGGEEFLLCFPETNASDAAYLCNELRNAVANADWSMIAPGLSVSLSAGVAEMRHGLDRSALINAADHKLYAAKKAGRNAVVG